MVVGVGADGHGRRPGRAGQQRPEPLDQLDGAEVVDRGQRASPAGPAPRPGRHRSPGRRAGRRPASATASTAAGARPTVPRSATTVASRRSTPITRAPPPASRPAHAAPIPEAEPVTATTGRASGAPAPPAAVTRRLPPSRVSRRRAGPARVLGVGGRDHAQGQRPVRDRGPGGQLDRHHARPTRRAPGPPRRPSGGPVRTLAEPSVDREADDEGGPQLGGRRARGRRRCAPGPCGRAAPPPPRAAPPRPRPGCPGPAASPTGSSSSGGRPSGPAPGRRAGSP